MVVRLQRFKEEYKTATFIFAIGKAALEIYQGMTFNPPESSKVLDSVVQKFKEYCIGQTYETFKRYLFNSSSQKEDESIDHYVSALRALQWLHDSLIRDRIVFGVKEPALRKKLLQERQLNSRKSDWYLQEQRNNCTAFKGSHHNYGFQWSKRFETSWRQKTKITEISKRFKECQKMQILRRKSQAQDGKMWGVWKDLRKV